MTTVLFFEPLEIGVTVIFMMYYPQNLINTEQSIIFYSDFAFIYPTPASMLFSIKASFISPETYQLNYFLLVGNGCIFDLILV